MPPETPNPVTGEAISGGPPRHVVAMPYPGRGHVNPMMNLCKTIATKAATINNVTTLIITLVLTEEWTALIGEPPDLPNLRIRSIPNVIPSELNRAADFAGFLRAVYSKMEGPFERLLDGLEAHHPVDAIVADTYLAWAVAVGNRRNIPVVSLWTMSPSVFSVFYHFHLLEHKGHFPADLSGGAGFVTRNAISIPISIPTYGGARENFEFHSTSGRDPHSLSVFMIFVENLHGDFSWWRGVILPCPAPDSERGDEIVDYIPGLSPTRLADFPTFFSGVGREVLGLALDAFVWVRRAQGLMFTSFYELEPRVIDALKSTLPFSPIYSVGPLIPHNTLADHTTRSTTKNDHVDYYFKWLDSHPKSSVLYVSLGSFLSVSKEQMDEIIAGVHESGVPFLWVARGDAERVQKACGEKGLVVPWCDQLRVLCHGSVGGFWTHCGWNSTLEGVFAGVPMLTFPIFYDQIPDRKLIVDEWKIGRKVVGAGEVVKRAEIASIVKEVMDLEGEESREMRRRVGELSESCRRALADEGSSEADINAFFREFLRSGIRRDGDEDGDENSSLRGDGYEDEG
ncbi:hypothetical protein Scep_005755 [Stephania cephalantha]|uniref:Uncharacterized protein n=1 Tax=Stephania cephalantha TaxID=152367 RepID=A0AAP0KV85_9MAGN